MSSATTNLTTAPSPPLGVTPRSVPTLEDLYQMTSEPDERVVIRNVDWSFYEGCNYWIASLLKLTPTAM